MRIIGKLFNGKLILILVLCNIFSIFHCEFSYINVNQNMTFNYTMEIENNFKFPLDSLEVESLSFKKSIFNSNINCDISNFSIEVHQKHIQQLIGDYKIIEIQINNNLIYAIIQSNYTELFEIFVFKMDIDQNSELITSIKLFFPKKTEDKIFVDFEKKDDKKIIIKKLNDFIYILIKNQIFIYNESQNDYYKINLVKKINYEEEILYFEPFYFNYSNFLLCQNIVQEVFFIKLVDNITNIDFQIIRNANLNFVKKIKSFKICMNSLFILIDDEILSFEIRENLNLLERTKRIFYTLKNTIEMLSFFRSVIFYNSTHINEYIIKNDCNDWFFLKTYTIQNIYNEKNLFYDNQKISTIKMNDFYLTIIVDNNDIIITMLQNYEKNYFFHLFSDEFKKVELNYITNLFHLLPFNVLNIFSIHTLKNYTLTSLLIKKTQENLICNDIDFGSNIKYVTTISEGYFCNQELYNFTDYKQNINPIKFHNNSIIDDEMYYYDPNVPCIRIDHFNLKKSTLSSSLDIPIIFSIVFSCFCLLMIIVFFSYKIIKNIKKRKERSKSYQIANSSEKLEKIQFFELKKPIQHENEIENYINKEYNTDLVIVASKKELDWDITSKKNILDHPQEMFSPFTISKNTFETSRVPMKSHEVSFEMNPITNRNDENIEEEYKVQPILINSNNEIKGMESYN